MFRPRFVAMVWLLELCTTRFVKFNRNSAISIKSRSQHAVLTAFFDSVNFFWAKKWKQLVAKSYFSFFVAVAEVCEKPLRIVFTKHQNWLEYAKKALNLFFII